MDIFVYRWFRFLAEVASYSDCNKMTAENLGIIFGPLLLRGASREAEQGGNMQQIMTDMKLMNLFVKTCILYTRVHGELFHNLHYCVDNFTPAYIAEATGDSDDDTD